MSEAFERTARLLRALFGVDAEALARAMSGATIALVADRPSPADEIAIALCATLLIRMDEAAPSIVVDFPATRSVEIPRLGAGSLPDALAEAHAGFDSAARIRAGRASSADLVLAFGSHRPGVPVSSSGWAAMIGESPAGSPGNPLAAAFAGSLAAAEALKAVLRRAGVGMSRWRDWRGAVSLWDYSLTAEPGPPLPAVLDLSHHAFAGAGGVATACAWTLALVPRSGDPLVVDYDDLDGPNLNRHLSGGFHDVGSPKAELLSAMLAAPSCRPVPRRERWEDLGEGERSPLVAVVSVDDDPTRRHLALDMPRAIVNAGTGEDGIYRMSAHNFPDGACLGCISRADRKYATALEATAAAVGLGPAELAPYIANQETLPQELIARMRVDESTRELLLATPGREFLRVACDRVAVSPDEPAVSAPMLSAAPGVLLAAEVMKTALGAPESGGTEVRTSILTGPHRSWKRQRAKLSSCECTDPAYVDYYDEKWGSEDSR